MKFPFLFLFYLILAGGTSLAAETYPKTILPEDTTQLWVSEGMENSDTVLILCQGGPKDHLSFEKKGKVIWRYLPNYERKNIVHLHQAQTLNSALFDFEGDFTKKIANQEVKTTSEILFRAVQYFKNRNKTVIVIGHSYGAFCVIHCLAHHIPSADSYVISAGRIIDNPLAIQTFLAGRNGSYKKAGKKFVADKDDDDEYSTEEVRHYKVRQILKGTIGSFNYPQLLAGKDLSNVLFFYSEKDERVGRLTAEELAFLKSKKVQIFRSKVSHSDVMKEVIDAVLEGAISL